MVTWSMALLSLEVQRETNSHSPQEREAILLLHDIWTETLVLEEADRVQRLGPADPPVKITTKKPDKRKKQSKDQQTTEESVYLLSNRVGTMEGILESTC